MSECILGLGLQQEKKTLNVFQNKSISARAILLISDSILVDEVQNFFIELDDITFNINGINIEKRFKTIQSNGLSIVNALKNDLNKTLK